MPLPITPCSSATPIPSLPLSLGEMLCRGGFATYTCHIWSHGDSVLWVSTARPPKLLPVFMDPFIRHWNGQGHGPLSVPIPLHPPRTLPWYWGTFPLLFRIFVHSQPLLPPCRWSCPSNPGVTPGTVTYPTCPRPGRGSQRGGCPHHHSHSSAGSTRKEPHSAEQRRVWYPKTELGYPRLNFGD